MIDIPPFREGEEVSAEKLDKMRQLLAASDGMDAGFIDSSGVYRRRSVSQRAELFELKTALAIDGTSHEWKCTGVPVAPDDYELWKANTSADAETLWHPAGRHQSSGSFYAEGCSLMGVGSRVYTQMIEGRRCIVSPPAGVWRFELKEDLALVDDYKQAYIVTWGGSSYNTDTSWNFLVYNAFNMFQGTGRDTSAPGARGYCAYFGDRNKWEILQLFC